MSNPLLTPAEQSHLDSVRALQHSPDNGLIPLFNVTWARFLSALIVAFNGGAYVGGNLIPVSYELAQGIHTGLPFLFNGLGLAVCSAVAHSLHDSPRNVLFTLAQTLLTSWV